MSISGTYTFALSGLDLGIGALVIEDGRAVGRDLAGVTYEGTATEIEGGRIRLEIRLGVPAGVPMVTGSSAQELPVSRQVRFDFPPKFGQGKPVEVPTDFGTVYAMIQRVPDDQAQMIAQAARNGFQLRVF